MPLELVTTDGIFALDGGEWEVTNNIWLVGDDREVLVFDAAHDHAPIVDAINGRRVVAVVLTHCHNDHINAAVPLRDAVDAPVLAHPDDQMLWDAVWPDDSLDGALSVDVVLRAGGHEINVLHTPGHSPGCCCFHDAGSGYSPRGCPRSTRRCSWSAGRSPAPGTSWRSRCATAWRMPSRPGQAARGRRADDLTTRP